MTIAPDIESQTAQCIRNVRSALDRTGAALEDVTRVQYILPDGSDFPKCWPVLREAFGRGAPAATMIQAGLADPRMKIEIEVTAIRGCGAHIERSRI